VGLKNKFVNIIIIIQCAFQEYSKLQCSLIPVVNYTNIDVSERSNMSPEVGEILPRPLAVK